MKNTHQVKVEFAKAKKQADNIDALAGKIEKNRGKLSDCKLNLSGYWDGDNSFVYRRKMGDREKELDSIILRLRTIAETIRQVAKTSYEAEMKAIKIAQERTCKK